MERWRDSPIVQTITGAFLVGIGWALGFAAVAALLVGLAVLGDLIAGWFA